MTPQVGPTTAIALVALTLGRRSVAAQGDAGLGRWMNTLAGRVKIAQNGGADLLYWTGPAASCDDALQRMRVLARRTDGVLAVKEPGALGLGDQAGDLVAYCRSGWRFSDPAPVSNPIPGNHGHPATGPIPFFITGGSRLVRRRTTSSREARTIDVAPTVSEVFGLDAPRGGYDGVSRL